MAQKLQDEYGVTIANLHLVVPEDKQDVTSQQDVQSVSVTVSEEEPQRSGAVEAVKPIEVDTSTPYESRIDNDASQDIQKFLAQEWQLEKKNKVQVYTEGGDRKKQMNEKKPNIFRKLFLRETAKTAKRLKKVAPKLVLVLLALGIVLMFSGSLFQPRKRRDRRIQSANKYRNRAGRPCIRQQKKR
ncbi:hypothetical protein GCM10020331_040740 [Ectobacillus funiculus]